MVRHIGLWKNSFDNKSDIGELIVTGNEIEFYYRGNSSIFNSYFDGFEGEFPVKPWNLDEHWA